PFLTKETHDEYCHVFETGETLVTEGSTTLKGSEIFTEVTKIPIISEGEVIQILTIIRDISVRKLAEDALKASEARYRNSAEIATLYLDLMGHDLANQLQVLSVGTEMLGLTELPDECVSIVDNIRASVEYSQDLITKVKSTQGFCMNHLLTLH
ncbi:MAG: hypothetical protein ACFFEV_08625, partial [Candidatus Thorarchaeota archaeon]